VADTQPGLLLGRVAVELGLITPEQLADASVAYDRLGGTVRLGEVLVQKGYLSEAQLQQVLARQREVLASQEAAVRAVPPPPPPPATPVSVPLGSRQLDRVLEQAFRRGASDLHVHSGAALKLRQRGELVDAGPVLDRGAAERVIREILTAEQQAALDASGQVDLAYSLPGLARYRVNVYRQQNGLDAVFRIVPERPPTYAELGLPNSLARIANYHQGMVLFTGPAGCGKSSTLAATLNIISEERRDHIITIEDPIEYLHSSKRCLVNQRAVGSHTGSFARALRAALREDPDVIAIGELRDLETISLALTAAETGHLVLATLHTNSALRTIGRMVGVFPAQQQAQIRTMLSESLRAVVSQRLLRRADGRGRVVAYELLIVNRAVSSLIREDKAFQIKSVLQTGAAQGMCTLDASLVGLVKSGVVTREEALRHAEEPQRLPAGPVAPTGPPGPAGST